MSSQDFEVDDILTLFEDITVLNGGGLEENWCSFLGADFGLPVIMLLLFGYQILFRSAEEALKIDHRTEWKRITILGGRFSALIHLIASQILDIVS